MGNALNSINVSLVNFSHFQSDGNVGKGLFFTREQIFAVFVLKTKKALAACHTGGGGSTPPPQKKTLLLFRAHSRSVAFVAERVSHADNSRATQICPSRSDPVVCLCARCVARQCAMRD